MHTRFMMEHTHTHTHLSKPANKRTDNAHIFHFDLLHRFWANTHTYKHTRHTLCGLNWFISRLCALIWIELYIYTGHHHAHTIFYWVLFNIYITCPGTTNVNNERWFPVARVIKSSQPVQMRNLSASIMLASATTHARYPMSPKAVCLCRCACRTRILFVHTHTHTHTQRTIFHQIKFYENDKQLTYDLVCDVISLSARFI